MVFVIAEVGSNWTSFEQAKDSIALAKNCGADAVKFQLFTEKDLFGPGVRGSMSTEKSGQHQLPVEWLPKLKEKADACGIEFMCSAFSPELLEAVNPYVKRHKIASSDNQCPQMLEKAYSFGKPVIVSLGATNETDVRRVTSLLDRERTTLMYCVSAYPSTQHNLFHIEGLKRIAPGFRVGLSDHSTDIYTCLSAKQHFGVEIIEKHVNFFDVKSPDSGHSLGRTSFKLLCDYLKDQLDYTKFAPQAEEREMFLRHNRRLIAIKDLQVGDVLRFGQNYGAYRSLENDDQGSNPLDWKYFEGKHLLEEVAKGKGIRPQAVPGK